MVLPFSVPSWPVLSMLWIATLAVCFTVLGGKAPLTARRVATIAAIGTYLAGVAALTMFPHNGAPDGAGETVGLLNLVPLAGVDPVTFGLNVIMTAPLGLLAPLVVRIRSGWAMAALGLVFSAGIELTQGFTDVVAGSGRVVDVNDLIANTAGAVLGFWALRTAGAARVRPFALRPSPTATPARYANSGSGPAR